MFSNILIFLDGYNYTYKYWIEYEAKKIFGHSFVKKRKKCHSMLIVGLDGILKVLTKGP